MTEHDAIEWWKCRCERCNDWVNQFGPGDPCATCGCGEREHRPGTKRRADCLYGGRHLELDCRRYVAAQPVLGL